MGRASVFRLGLLGLLLPGFFLYLSDNITTVLFFQGFFYDYISSSVNGSGFHWLTTSWFQSAFFGSPLVLYLYLASFALAVLALIVLLGSTKGGGILFLLAGLANLGFMFLFTPLLEDISAPLNVIPIPVGAVVLLLTGFIGINTSDSNKVISYVRE